MSIIAPLNAFHARYAPSSFADASPPPGVVSDGDDSRWWDDGLGFLMDALAHLGLRRRFRASEATDDQRRGVLSHLVMTGRAALAKVGTTLVQGGSTLAGWYRDMKAGAMPRLYAGVMAMIGTVTPAPHDRLFAREQAAEQVGYLDRFRRGLGDATIPLDGRIGPRSALYASAAWIVAVEAWRQSMIRDGHKEERRLLGDAHHCGVCPVEAAKGWVPAGTFRKIGDSPCRLGCRCYF